MNRFLKFFFILALTSLFIASCGDDDDDPGSNPVMMDCDDGCPYTEDSFDTVTGQCVNTLITPDCDDNNSSTDDTYDEINCQCNNSFAEGTTNYLFTVDGYTQEKVQEALILMQEGDTITFGAGTFDFTTTLSLDDKRKVLIIGAGIDDTYLDFSGQTAGAEGLKITADSSIVANFTVQNSSGDAIKAKDCNYFSFINVGTVWTGEPSIDNGAYGLYPVTSKHILIDGCYARGASDAGLYVGQCENVVVKNSKAEFNVAGIEIENTKYADVYDNVAINNTGGLLVFDLPGLPAGEGTNCRAFNNLLENNNHANFAPSGNIVANVPVGTGLMLLATKNVEFFDNTLINNNVMSIGIVDYQVLAALPGGASSDDPNYITYPRSVYIHDNEISRTNDCPTEEANLISGLLMSFFVDCEIPEILWDGITDLDNISGENSICTKNSGTVVNLDLGMYNLGDTDHEVFSDFDGFDCTRDPLPPVEVLAPTL